MCEDIPIDRNGIYDKTICALRQLKEGDAIMGSCEIAAGHVRKAWSIIQDDFSDFHLTEKVYLPSGQVAFTKTKRA